MSILKIIIVNTYIFQAIKKFYYCERELTGIPFVSLSLIHLNFELL